MFKGWRCYRSGGAGRRLVEGKGLSGLEAWVGFGQRTGNSESQPGEKEKEESVSPSVVSDSWQSHGL